MSAFAAQTPAELRARLAAQLAAVCDKQGLAPLAARLDMHRQGLPALVLVWMENSEDDAELVELCFTALFAMTAQVNRDDEAEEETCVLMSKHASLFRMGCVEFKRQPVRPAPCIKALEVLQAMSLCETSAQAVAVAPGVVSSVVDLMQRHGMAPVGQNALNVLKNLALFPGTHATLKANDILSATVPLVNQLESKKNDDELISALRAVSLICRVFGRDEAGRGSELIEKLFVSKLIWILDQVTRAGPTEHVLGSSWDPANIVLDLSTLAQSDKNKPLLAPCIGTVTTCLEKRGSTNKRLVRFSLSLLSLLTYDPTKCQAELMNQRKALLSALAAVDPLVLSIGSRRELASLRDWLNSGDRQSRRASLIIPAIFSNTRASKDTVSAQREASSETSGAKHVFLSYSWDNSNVVLQVFEVLRTRGFPLWLDRINMGENLVDSMVDGIANAACLVAFMSPSYKGSANCRRELELAVKLTRPIIFVNVVQDFVPDGWLGFFLGTQRWVAAFDVIAKDQWMSEIAQRSIDAFSVKPDVKDLPATIASSTSQSTPASTDQALVIALERLAKELSAVKEELKKSREENQAFRDLVLTRLPSS